MRRLLGKLWRGITFPFRIIWRLLSSLLHFLGRILAFLLRVLTLPLRVVRAVYRFMRKEPEEHPLGEILSELAQNEQMRQLFWREIEILRAHLLRSVLAIVVGVGLAFAYTSQLVEFLALPIGGLGALRAIEVTESIGVFMKVALLAGLAIASPYVAFEFWLFAAPGLRPRERFYSLIGIPLAAIFFVGGMAFTYFMLLPSALPFLLNFLGIQAQLRPSSYFSFVTGLMFWIGVAFEFPLVIYALTAMGLIKPKPLVQNWRMAVIVIAILAAAITPTVDPVNMGLVMLPMSLLYFISILLSYLAYAGRRKSTRKTLAEERTT